ncbi:MAG: monovalent cation/H+ antiporter subunit D family protein [Deltaproteobacteria bacterium]|nr:monovalent cation/H+ antiporter subunit D family protein [Deltaproteobacteria bacterium]
MEVGQFPILIIIVPLLIAFAIPLTGLWTKRLAFPLVVVAISASFASSLVIALAVHRGGPLNYYMGGWDPPWGIAYYIDHLNAFMAVLVSTIALLITFYSKESIAKERPGKEVPFYCVFLLLFVGLMGMLVTGDMFNLYVFLEVSSLAAYALIAIGDEKGATLAAFKYVVIGTVGACLYLLGVGYLFISTGSLNMADLAQRLPELYESKTILVSLVFFTVGLAIKMGLFPLHTWMPGSYTHAPSTVSAYIAPLMTKVGAYAFIRVMFSVFQPEFSLEKLHFQEILGWTAAVAIIYGSVIAISQKDFKRMLAYSSVSQVGYIVLGITMGNPEGFIGGVLHILNHAFMKGCLFAVAGCILYRQGTRNIEHFGFLHRKMPVTAIAFAIAALSMIGIPPTAGFFSKWYLILGAVNAGNWVFVGVIMASSLLNAIYFFKVVELIFWKPQTEAAAGSAGTIIRKEAPGGMLVPMVILAAGVLALGFASNWVVETFISQAIPPGIL